MSARFSLQVGVSRLIGTFSGSVIGNMKCSHDCPRTTGDKMTLNGDQVLCDVGHMPREFQFFSTFYCNKKFAISCAPVYIYYIRYYVRVCNLFFRGPKVQNDKNSKNLHGMSKKCDLDPGSTAIVSYWGSQCLGFTFCSPLGHSREWVEVSS